MVHNLFDEYLSLLLAFLWGSLYVMYWRLSVSHRVLLEKPLLTKGKCLDSLCLL